MTIGRRLRRGAAYYRIYLGTPTRQEHTTLRHLPLSVVVEQEMGTQDSVVPSMEPLTIQEY